MVDFIDANGLAGQRFAEIDFLAVEAEAAATGDHNGAVVKRVVRLGNAIIGPRCVRTGDIGNTSFLRHGGHFWPKRIL